MVENDLQQAMDKIQSLVQRMETLENRIASKTKKSKATNLKKGALRKNTKTKPRWASHLFLFHRAKTAFRAISDLRLADSFAMRPGPPLRPPSLPSATAAGFFFRFVFLRERLGMSHDCYFWKSWKVISIRESSVSLNRLLIKSQLVCPRLQKSPWFLRQTVVTPTRRLFEWWNGVSV